MEKVVDECSISLDIGNCVRVKQTKYIKFEEDYKSFRLHAGNSLYAFCIGPELTLEHLYWGKFLEAGYDLRYLSQSCRNSHFNTVEAIPLPQFDGKIILDYETLDEVEKTWKENRAMTTITDADNMKNKRTSDVLNFQRRRLENYSWRILCKATQEDYHHQASICSPDLKLGHNSMSNPNLLSSPRKNSGKLEVKFSDPSSNNSSSNNNSNTITRNRRAYSSPPKSHSLDQGIMNERYIDINHNKHSIDLNSSTLKNMHSSIQIDTENKNNHNNSNSNSNKNNDNNIDKHFVDTQSNTSTNKNPWSTIRKRNKNLSFGRSIGAVGKGSLCVEYTDYGTGDFRSPSFAVVDNYNGSNISPLRYKHHAIYRGRYL